MKPFRLITGLLLAGAVMALADCASMAPPPAVLAYAGKDCVEAPNLSAAISLTPPKPQVLFALQKPLDATSACLNRAGGATPYVLYALPAVPTGKTFTVGAVLEQARLAAPEVSLLDQNGKVSRRFEPDDFLFRGGVLSVQFKPRPGDAYILVAVDAHRVGQEYKSIAIGTRTTSSTTAVGGAVVTMNWTSGTDQKMLRTYSYEGMIEASVFDAEAAKSGN